MADIELPSGLHLTLPEGLRVAEIASRPKTSDEFSPAILFSRKSIIPSTPIRSSRTEDSTANLLAGLSKEDLQLVDQVQLLPTAEATSTSGKRAFLATTVPDVQTATLEVPLLEGEEAILLIEQEGMYVWQVAETPAVREKPTKPGDEVSLSRRFSLTSP